MIVGTAGHIDHGKTAVVRKLTGIDTDRLKEEKARGISIDLGFAYWPRPNGAIVSFELKSAGRDEVFRFMNQLRVVVPATSLGDVHSMRLYPAMSSHRELSPKHRERMGIGDSLVRLSVGIEAIEDIIGDLAQALEDSGVAP